MLAWAEAQPWARAMAACQQDAGWHAEGDVWTHTKMVCRQLPLLEEWPSLSPHERTVLALHGPVPRLRQAARPRCSIPSRPDPLAEACLERRAPRPDRAAGSRLRSGDPRRDRPAGPLPRPPGVPAGEARPGARGDFAVVAGEQPAALPVRPGRHPRPDDRAR